MSEVRNIMDNPAQVRNMSVIAHVDHGTCPNDSVFYLPFSR